MKKDDSAYYSVARITSFKTEEEADKKIKYLENKIGRKLTIINKEQFTLLKEPKYKEFTEKDLCLKESTYIYCTWLSKY